MSMLTFFAALRQKMANSPSLKLSVSAIIHDTEIVNADSQRANVENIEIIDNHINFSNVQ